MATRPRVNFEEIKNIPLDSEYTIETPPLRQAAGALGESVRTQLTTKQENEKMRIIIYILFVLTSFSAIGQTTTKEDTTLYIYVAPEPIQEDDIWEFPKKTMQSRAITIELMDTAQIIANVFYYSPRMESKDYSYWQELGNQNNHLGWTRFNNKVEVEIPDTCEQETKLIVYAIGYEPLFIDISNIQNESHIFVHLTPKIYSSSILLTESKSSRIKPFLVDHINPPRPEIKTETQTQIFYGRGPKWNYCMVCYPELWVARIEDFSLKEIHRELKKGKKVSVLLHINKSEEVEAIEIEGFSGKKILPKIQQDMQKSRWRFDDTRMNNGFQYRVHFVLNRKNETMYLREMGQRK